MVSLVEIARENARQNGIVLFDSSITGLDEFVENLESASTYQDLDFGSVVDIRVAWKEFLEFIQAPNSYTVKSAHQQFLNLQERVLSRQKQLEEPYKDIREVAVSDENDGYLSLKRRKLAGLIIHMDEIKEFIGKKIATHHHTDMLHPDRIYYKALHKNLPRFLEDHSNQPHLDEINSELLATALYYFLNEGSPITFAINRSDFANIFDRLVLKSKRIRLYTKNSDGNFELHLPTYETPTQAAHS